MSPETYHARKKAAQALQLVLLEAITELHTNGHAVIQRERAEDLIDQVGDFVLCSIGDQVREIENAK